MIETNKILAEQIRFTYKNSNKKIDDEIMGIDFENFGRLSIINTLEIQFIFKEHIITNIRYLKLFFEPRLKFENAATYIREHNFSIYPRMKNSTFTDFELALEYFANFKATYEALEDYCKYNDIKI